MIGGKILRGGVIRVRVLVLPTCGLGSHIGRWVPLYVGEILAKLKVGL